MAGDATAFWLDVLAQHDRAVARQREHERAHRGGHVALIEIPAGSQPGRCKGEDCGAQIYWVERPRKGKPGTSRLPVSTDCDGGREPDSMQPGKGVLHFTNCPNAGQF